MKKPYKLSIVLCCFCSFVSSCSSNGTSQINTNSTAQTSSITTSVTSSQDTASTNGSKNSNTDSDTIIHLKAGKKNDYSEKITLNKGTEFSETRTVFFLPKGKYSAKNVSSNMAQLSIYSRETSIVNGYEEPKETIFVKLFKEGEKADIEITGDQYIYITKPDEFDITIIDIYDTSSQDEEKISSDTTNETNNEETTLSTSEDALGAVYPWELQYDHDTFSPLLMTRIFGITPDPDHNWHGAYIQLSIEESPAPDGDMALLPKIYLFDENEEPIIRLNPIFCVNAKQCILKT